MPPDPALHFTQLMTSDLANVRGDVHGGKLLALLDNAAYACAVRHAGHHCVTRAIEQSLFHAPARVGDLLHVRATLDATGRSSLDISLEVQAEDLRSGALRLINRSSFTMVAVDEQGQPVPVPPWQPTSAEARERQRRALARRAARQ